VVQAAQVVQVEAQVAYWGIRKSGFHHILDKPCHWGKIAYGRCRDRSKPYFLYGTV
jgi:hypothetical protein